MEAYDKYRQCLIQCEGSDLSRELKARAHSNCALALLKVVNAAVPKQRTLTYECWREYNLRTVLEHCDECLELKIERYIPKVRVIQVCDIIKSYIIMLIWEVNFQIDSMIQIIFTPNC